MTRTIINQLTKPGFVANVIKRVPRRKLKTMDEKKRASVLIPIVSQSNRPKILFTKRTSLVGSHKGQVSFPGGRADGNENQIETALRETEEEIGVSSLHIEVAGMLHDCHSYYHDVVTPVVGIINQSFDLHQNDIVDYKNRFAPLKLSEQEIEDIMLIDIESLLNPQFIEFDDLGYRAGHVPVFTAGKYPIWGLTAIILRDFLHELNLWTLKTPTGGGRIVDR